MRDKMPRKGGRWWFSWRGRNTTIKEVSLENTSVSAWLSKGLRVSEQSRHTEPGASSATVQAKAAQNRSITEGRINSKWIKDLNVRPETIQLLEENIGKTLSDIHHSRILYDPPPRILEIKAKINK